MEPVITSTCPCQSSSTRDLSSTPKLFLTMLTKYFDVWLYKAPQNQSVSFHDKISFSNNTKNSSHTFGTFSHLLRVKTARIRSFYAATISPSGVHVAYVGAYNLLFLKLKYA